MNRIDLQRKKKGGGGEGAAGLHREICDRDPNIWRQTETHRWGVEGIWGGRRPVKQTLAVKTRSSTKNRK